MKLLYVVPFFFALGAIFYSCGGKPTAPQEQDQYATGLVIPEGWDVGVDFEPLAIPTSMPESFEYKNLPPVKNQKSCGSCVSFAVTGVLEFLEYGVTGTYSDLAEQTIVSRCSNAVSCQGGWVGDAMGYLTKTGIPLEKDDPYKARNSSCVGAKVKSKLARWAFVGQQGREPTTDEIKAAIMTYGPVAVTVAAGGSFKSYRGGTYTACNATRTDHAVQLVGFKTENGQTVWRLKNSWSKSWGQDGYMDILAEKNGKKCNSVGQTVAFAVLDFDF